MQQAAHGNHVHGCLNAEQYHHDMIAIHQGMKNGVGSIQGDITIVHDIRCGGRHVMPQFSILQPVSSSTPQLSKVNARR